MPKITVEVERPDEPIHYEYIVRQGGQELSRRQHLPFPVQVFAFDDDYHTHIRILVTVQVFREGGEVLGYTGEDVALGRSNPDLER